MASLLKFLSSADFTLCLCFKVQPAYLQHLEPRSDCQDLKDDARPLQSVLQSFVGPLSWRDIADLPMKCSR